MDAVRRQARDDADSDEEDYLRPPGSSRIRPAIELATSGRPGGTRVIAAPDDLDSPCVALRP